MVVVLEVFLGGVFGVVLGLIWGCFGVVLGLFCVCFAIVLEVVWGI